MTSKFVQKTAVMLADGWVLSTTTPDLVPEAIRRPLTGLTIPGCVHTDLLAAGLIADPYMDENENDQHWIARAGWQYVTRFDAGPLDGRRYELVFDGLDTVVEVTLNGESILRAANMHRDYRVDVTELVRADGNELCVRFDSVYAYVDAVRDLVGGDRPNVYPEPFNLIRKMACNFGWDWGPTVVTAGIWKDIRLESWGIARIDSVRPLVTVGTAGGGVSAKVRIAAGPGCDDLTLTMACAGRRVVAPIPPGTEMIELNLDGLEVDRWWPAGHGTQPRYGLDVVVESASRGVADKWSRTVGFRDVRVRSELDADGLGRDFVIAVNGIDLFARGVNWIPDDCFVSRIDSRRYRERLTQTVDANVDLVRIWGGGIYEKDEFYDICDELGLLVWQDFPFACAAYPEEEPLWSEVTAEAESNVERLMSHPSLVMWNGNNENLWGYEDWGWKEALAGHSWGAGYYFDLLPAVVADVDPSRTYTPGSPYSGDRLIHPNDPARATMHSWEVWNRQDYTRYRESSPRFVAEFGFQGPANWSTVTSSLSPSQLFLGSTGLAHHQKADDGNEKLARGMAPHLPPPDFSRSADVVDPMTTLENWHYLTQVNQARAVAYGIDYFRALRPHCMGSIVWQINDCWPVSSWSAIDGDGRLKPLWYALRRAYRPVRAIIAARPGQVVEPAAADLPDGIIVVNDSPERFDGVVAVQTRDRRGMLVDSWFVEVSVGPSDQRLLPWQSAAEVEFVVLALGPDIPGAAAAIASPGSARHVHAVHDDIALALPAAAFEVGVTVAPMGLSVTIDAATILRDVVVNADRIDPGAIVDDHLLTVFPGERLVVGVRTCASADDPRWLNRPVIRCVNDSPWFWGTRGD